MGGLFSKKKETQSRVTEQDRAVLQLKQQRDKMKQYLKRLDNSLEKEKSTARRLLKEGKKDRALLILKKKKYREQLVRRAMGQMDNLEKMITDIEEAQMNIEIMDRLSVGNDCLKELHSLMSVEDVERILDDAREGVEYQQEIDSLVSGSLTSEDEEDILAELAELTKEDEPVPELPEVPADKLPELPDVPTDKLPTPTRESRNPGSKQKEGVLA